MNAARSITNEVGATRSEDRFRVSASAVADAIMEWPLRQASTRQAVELVGKQGLIHQRWARHDNLFGVLLTEELARHGLLATAVVVSLHVESVIAMLRRFSGPDLQPTIQEALAGTSVGCVAASEPGGGSNLNDLETLATKTAAGWHVRGEKKFVTLADQADFAITLARLSNSPKLAAFLIPRDGYDVVHTHRLVGGSPLATSWVRLDAVVPDSHLLGRPGLGLIVLTSGLTQERLAVASLVTGACQLALTLAVTRAKLRQQFGQPLFGHQVIRLRLADLYAQLDTLITTSRALATRPSDPRRIAGLKVTAARFGERCISECMHIFGGDGYVEDASPLGRLWRDIRLARLGGGSDEMMWEIVAGGLAGDVRAYRQHVRSCEAPNETTLSPHSHPEHQEA